MAGPAEKPRSQVYDIPNGAILGKYEILRKLATGGMAEIYLARARGTAGFEKLVVLKRILPNVAADPTFVQMFLDEARLAATLQHPNIADVYDVGEADGAYFFTMEFIHGQDTRAIRHAVRGRNEAVPLSISLAIIHGVAAALDYAHEKTGPDGKKLGLIHRDVSSSNVLVSYDGAVKLVDFGIARATVSQHKTMTGTLKGKIPYMSPEQCKAHPMDKRSDLFSLGVLLYELTVGRRPFRGESEFAIMDQIVYQGAQRPTEIVKGYPAELEAIVMKLLARDANERYESAEVLIHDFDEFLTQQRLWVSAKQLSKYMRTVFADRMAELDRAERDGVPFAQHVAKTITSQSQRSDIQTPVSAFEALQPRASQPIEPQYSRPATYTPTPTSMPVPAPIPNIPTGATVLPAAPRRSRRGAMIVLFGALAMGGGGIGAYVLLGSGKSETLAPAAKKDDEVHKMDVTPAPAAKKDDAVHTMDATPAPAPTPPPTPTPAPTPVAETPVPAHKHVVTPPVGHKQPVKKDKPDAKGPAWDPNSPLLPQ